MAVLLKNQILKHLSKFTKNLSADKINLSTLKGEGELSNLELNEDILTQLLELPTWLRITKAVCNHVRVKIQWTKLKSQPIRLYLDEVIVETETCEQPRPPNNQSQQAAGGKYGFVDRVMDGIYVHVNSVVVKLNSHKFQASLQLSRVTVQSMTPTWQAPNDLRSTRIRDAGRGEVLLFKEIEWQTTRIEATAVGLGDDFLTPLRLIANQAKIRIVVKKRLIDSTIISSRLTLLLDDLLWVLTITQLKAAILYANSLKEVIERSSQQSKRLAAEKLKKQGYIPDSTNMQQQQRQANERQESTTAKYFTKFDVLSTSYHLITSHFDLHLCDDSSPDQDEEKRHWKINGGSMQITFFKLSIDFYPFHPAETGDNESGERKKWYRYADNIGSRNPWVQKLFSEFREEAVKLRRIVESSPMHSSSSAPSLLANQPMPSSPGATNKRNLSPSNSKSVQSSPVHGPNQAQRNSLGSRSAQASPQHQAQVAQHQAQVNKSSTRLLESCFVFKVEDMTIYMVSMPGQKRAGPKKLLCSDKQKLHLPPEMSMLHVEYTDYFFPEGLEYPVPHSNIYVMVNPIRITLDFLTLLWSNVFLLTLSNSLDMDFDDSTPKEHVDIKAEFLMPRIIALAEEKIDNQPDRPDAVQLQVSKLVVSNRRTEDKMTREDLKAFLNQYNAGKLFSQTEFPNDDDHHGPGEGWIPASIRDHALAKDDPYIDKTVKVLLNHNTSGLKLSPSDASLQDPHHIHHHLPFHQLNCNSLKRLADSDIWSAAADQVWLEFLGVPNSKNRPAPFVEAVPITLWLSSRIDPKQCGNVTRAFHCKVNTLNPTTLNPTARNGELHQGISAGQAPLGPVSTQYVFDNPDIQCDKNGSDHHVDTRHVSGSGDKHVPQRQQDGTDHRHDAHDGNSSATSHQKYPFQEDDRRPTKLSISGCASNGSRANNKKLSRTDSFHESDHSLPECPSRVKARGDDIYERAEQCSDRRRGRQNADSDVGYHQSRHRKEKHREDSRSNSSPPLLPTESYSRRREESRERVSKERRMRHSSSSSAEGAGGRKSGEVDGRSSGEGQVSSDSFRSAEERKNGRDGRRSEEYYFDEERVKPKRREGSSGRSKDDRFHRSGSRERRGFYERQVKEADRRSPKDEEDRVSPRDVYDRKSARDTSRETVERRRDMLEGPTFERSSLKSNKRDQMDGIPLSRRLSRDRDGGMSDDATDIRRRRHRSHSRGGESDTSREKRVTDRDHGRSRYPPDDPEFRSRPGDPVRSKNSDADCDNDRFSPASHSSLETLGRDGGQSLVADELKAGSNQREENTDSRPDETWDRTSKRLPPEGCKSQEDVCCRSGPAKTRPEVERNICVLTKIYDKLRIQLNHFQYLFLLRLSESFAAFQNDLTSNLGSLTSDASKKQSIKEASKDQPPAIIKEASKDQPPAIIKEASKDQPPAIIKEASKDQPPAITMIPLMIKELEFAVVCPYQMHQRTFSDDFSNFSPFLQGLPSGQDAVFGDDGDGTCFPQLVDSIKGQRSRDDSSLRPFHSSISFKSSSSSQLENMSHLGPPADISQRNRAFTAGGSNLVLPGGVTGPGAPTPFTSVDVMSQSVNSIGKDSGIGVERKPPRQQHSRGGGGGSVQRGVIGGASDVKKAFTSAFSSFADKVKHTMDSHDDRHSIGDDFETSSVRTDTSEDDYEHLSLDDAEEVPAFFHDPPPPEITPTGGDNYSDVGDFGDSVSMYAESSTTKGKEMVYVVLFKLDHIEVVSENSADCKMTKIQLAKLGSIQLGNISYEDFQSRFSSTKGYLQEDIPDTHPHRYPIRIKTVVPASDPKSIPDPGRMIVHADDFSLQFKMSSLTCLSDFSEDEKLPESLPMSLDVRNLLLVLEEDRPSVNVTSPGSVPLNLHIQQISIERGRDGIFYISGSPNSTPFVHTPSPTPAEPKPVLINAVTSPILSPDGTMALLMASQNESVLLRRQLEEVRRANRLYEHQLLQCKNIQDQAAGGRHGMVTGMGRGGFTGMLRKRQSFNADSLSSSPSSSYMDHIAGQSTNPREEVDPARDELERENLKLQQEVMRLEDELLTVSKEKESLLQTLQLLQDELLASERKQRARSKVV